VINIDCPGTSVPFAVSFCPPSANMCMSKGDGDIWKEQSLSFLIQHNETIGRINLSQDIRVVEISGVKSFSGQTPACAINPVKEMDTTDEAGGGLVFWHPKGAIVRQNIEDFWKRTHVQHGYDLLYTPHVAKADLWKISGHLEFYKENMINQMDVENEQYQLRPMNCPYHILVYKHSLRSYRDLPFKVAELGTVYRYEMSGSLHGLFRVRGFTQDDAHVFCLPSQIKEEIRSVLDPTEAILSQFDFKNYEINLSTKPEKAVDSDVIWEKATRALKDALGRQFRLISICLSDLIYFILIQIQRKNGPS